MSVIYIDSYRFGAAYDPDAAAYIARVEGASGDNQALEIAVKDAINAFVVGCKADGIWNAIKASCILAGARTLSGALQPLVGTAPTNNNFASGDYNRKTGLVGDGSTKYLDSNRASNADPQNNAHWAVFPTDLGAGATFIMANEFTSNTADFNGFYFDQNPNISAIRSRNGAGTGTDQALYVTYSPSKLIAASRNSATSFTQRYNSISQTANVASYTPDSSNHYLYRRVNPSSPLYSNARIAFYSIGEALDLALLDARVTDLINKFAEVIP